MSDIATVGQARRRRLPHRRECETRTIEFAHSDGTSARFEASVGFDELGRPKEIFLFGAKEGTDMAAILADTAVALSVALQHGVRAEAMALSVSRLPAAPDEKPSLPGSIIGAALDLLAGYEREAGS